MYHLCSVLAQDKVQVCSRFINNKKVLFLKMGRFHQAGLILTLSFCAIFYTNGQNCQKDVVETNLQIPNDVKDLLQEHLQKFNYLLEASPSERKTKFLDSLNELSSFLKEVCGFELELKDYFYEISMRYQLTPTDPFAFCEPAQEDLAELIDNHGSPDEVTQALGTLITPETFVHLARYIYGLAGKLEDKMLPPGLNVNLDEWKKLKIYYDQYKQTLDSFEELPEHPELPNIVTKAREVLMDLAIILSAEKALANKL